MTSYETSTPAPSSDDNIANALAELQKVEEFSRTYDGPNNQRHDGTFGHVIRSIRYLAAEIEALRDDQE